MREIEFRIFANGIWYDKCLVGNTNDIEDNKWTCPMVWLEDEKEWVNCDNGIICQYTGLKDKNGTKIFESDIVVNQVFKATVEWNNSFCGFYPFCNEMSGIFVDECEVIGNIYEENKD